LYHVQEAKTFPVAASRQPTPNREHCALLLSAAQVCMVRGCTYLTWKSCISR